MMTGEFQCQDLCFLYFSCVLVFFIPCIIFWFITHFSVNFLLPLPFLPCPLKPAHSSLVTAAATSRPQPIELVWFCLSITGFHATLDPPCAPC